MAPPSVAATAGFDLPTAYAVEAELTRPAGRRPATAWSACKVGYANKAVWRVLKLETLVWALMYDDTVAFAEGGEATARRRPDDRAEDRARDRRPAGGAAAGGPHRSGGGARVTSSGWRSASRSSTASTPTGSSSRPTSSPPTACTRRWSSAQPLRPDADTLATLAEQLAAFAVTLSKDDAVAAQGGGKNVLRSPALCLAELASARDAPGPAAARRRRARLAPARSPNRSRSPPASAGRRGPTACRSPGWP